MEKKNKDEKLIQLATSQIKDKYAKNHIYQNVGEKLAYIKLII